MVWLQEHVQDPKAIVHIDVYTAMNGCNRFLELRPDWTFDKTEDLNHEELQEGFTHLISAEKVPKFKVLHSIRAFSGILMKIPKDIVSLSRDFPFVHVLEEDKLYVLERANESG